MPHHVASDQGLHCLLTVFPVKKRKKRQKRPIIPEMTNRLVQHIIVEESTSTHWVNSPNKFLCNFIFSYSGVWVHLCISAIVQREKTFVDFLFASLDNIAFPNVGYTIKGKNWLIGEQILSLKS